MDKRCAVQITQAANGFIVESASRDVREVRSMESMMVFDSVERLSDWLRVHYERDLATLRREQAEAMRNVAAPWVEGRTL